MPVDFELPSGESLPVREGFFTAEARSKIAFDSFSLQIAALYAPLR